jgi:pseudouridine synthase
MVNGKKVQSPDAWVDPEIDRVTVDGRPLSAREKIYLLLYKPKGYLTTYKDPEGRPTVYDLISADRDDEREWIFPVGRLDQDTTGLLILTNDSKLGDYITSPASKVPKTYLVKASVLLDDAQLDSLRRGLALSDGMTAPALVERIRDGARYTFFEITITEGRNRQVRRMVEALGARVLKLVRTCIGPIRIGDLQIGKHRPLTNQEVSMLLR